MPSLIAWLDASSDEQRRMREIIKLFSDRDSRDELGIGSIRDGLSDALFPGTSVLLTRARYLLFVPWCYQLAARKPDPIVAVDRYQRELIHGIRDAGGDFAGLIGVRVGDALKTLPSTIYWTPLRAYGILVDPDALEQAAAIVTDDDLDGHRTVLNPWSSTLPPSPVGFPTQIAGGFQLSRQEAGWLGEKILESAPGSLLAHLINDAPADDSAMPWHDEAALRVQGDARSVLDAARHFSTAMYGAQLLYNLLLANEAAALSEDTSEELSDRYRGRLAEWTASADFAALENWRESDLWRLLSARHARIPARTTQFVDNWLAIIRSTPGGDVADSLAAHDFVRVRERTHKGAQARLGNPRRLGGWRGGSGDGQLQFRWSTVRGILRDIHDGLVQDA
ncbi:MAG TPA: DUF6361 family protein [Galbitalea sp.]|jgi:hypothetical protein|nr:DUF6361 family protein [Galbitalea sp.]